MGLRLALAVVLVSVLCLFSTPLYQSISWKGRVPASLRDRVTLVQPGVAVTDSFTGLERYHALRLPANRLLKIDIVSDRFDPAVTLYSASSDSLERLGYNDDFGGSTNAHLEKCLDREGLYVLKVSAIGSSGRLGPYTLRTSADNANCTAIAAAERQRQQDSVRLQAESEQRTREQAAAVYGGGRPIHIGDQVYSNLGASSRRTPEGKAFESWDLTCEAGVTFQVDITGNGYDAYAMIVDALGNRLASDDDSGGSLNPRLTFTCPASATYHVVSTTFTSSAGGGSYTLRLSPR
jgi:hypothetical protein